MHPFLGPFMIALVIAFVLLRASLFCVVLGRTWDTTPLTGTWLSRWLPAAAMAVGFGLAPLVLGTYLHRNYAWADTVLQHAFALWFVPAVFGISMAFLFIQHGRSTAPETSDLETSPTS